VAALTDLSLDDPRHHRVVVGVHLMVWETIKTLAGLGATLPQLVTPHASRHSLTRTREEVSAEQMEHLLAEENIARMMEVLGHPQTDPHGKRIPSLNERPPLLHA
jgi:hypothetical protein